MNFYLIPFDFKCVYKSSAIDIMPELKRNILNFGYGINFRYEGMLWHSFDRFYVVTKFELPKIEDLHLTTVQFDSKWSYLDTEKDKNNLSSSSYLPKLLTYCEKIVPFVEFYKKQVAYYNHTAYEVLANKIDLILPTFLRHKRKRSIIASVISGLIGLAYEGISSFLHHKRQKALNKAVKIMERKADIQHNKIFHLEDIIIMYGIYNSDTLAQLIETVHRMHNTTSWQERTFVGKINQWFELYLHQDGVGHYAINSVLFLTIIWEKYVKMYERF